MAANSPNRRHNLTYKEVIQAFQSASAAHLGINTFDTGTLDFLDANAVNKEYPYVYMRPLSSQGVLDRERGLTFELYSMDVPKLSDESPVDAQSRTEMYIYDLLAWFNKGTTDRQQIYNVEITDISPVNEAFQDRVYGWVATINVLTPFKWDYCDYPQIPLPTATPTPTPAPTPVPTPTPTPTPSFYSFLINDINITSSLSGACVLGGPPSSSVYVEWDGQGDAWPINTIGKQIYTDEALTIPYTASATDDDDYYRLAFSEGEYGALHVEWSNFTSSNIVLDAEGCNFPTIVTSGSVASSIQFSTVYGYVSESAGRTLENYGFKYGTTSGSLDSFVSGSPLNAEGVWSASLTATPNSTLYYRASAEDANTSFQFLGNELTASLETSYPVLLLIDDTRVYTGNNPQDAINDRTGSECGLIMLPAWDDVFLASEVPNDGNLNIDLSTLAGRTLYTDEAMTIEYTGGQYADGTVGTPVVKHVAWKDYGGARQVDGFMSATNSGSPQNLLTILASSTSCP